MSGAAKSAGGSPIKVDGVEVGGGEVPRATEVLTPEALGFVAALQRRFGPRREQLLAMRAQRQARWDRGEKPTFLSETREVRESSWRVAPVPKDLQDRRVEITGPVERKMVINALNSGARCFMADFEDANSPTWANCVEGQANLTDAIERRIDFASPEGKEYKLKEKTAVLLVRPRGWHLVEKHLLVDGKPVSASLFDFGLYFFHNAKRLLAKGSGPYFYLPKMESHLEARLWNEVFVAAQQGLGVPVGTIKATVLVETLPAAFEMEEILYELRDHSAGLNAGRWDYLFSAIKTFRNREDCVLPDRAQLTMTVPFMRAYTQLLVKTCHKRGAHAMGGMAAFIPSRKDAQVNEVALRKVREDKTREVGDGFDGTWVAHPDLVPVAQEVFDAKLGDKPNQLDRERDDVKPDAAALVDFRVEGGVITDEGVRTNVEVALLYIDSWLRGIGAAAIHNLMEDAATAEISRSQLWQWTRHGQTTREGTRIDRAHVSRVIAEESARLAPLVAGNRLKEAAAILEQVSLAEDFPAFLTLPAYELID